MRTVTGALTKITSEPNNALFRGFANAATRYVNPPFGRRSEYVVSRVIATRGISMKQRVAPGSSVQATPSTRPGIL